MEFIVESEEEQEYLSQLIQKYNNVDIKEYKYLQNLVFKYCFIPNAAL